MIVVADASPLQYLVLIEHVDVLPSLFGTIGVPPAVLSELSHPVAPEAVRRWAVNKPDWLLIRVPRETLVAAMGPWGQESERRSPWRWNCRPTPWTIGMDAGKRRSAA